ncbi:MAG: regulatory protein RecX [Rikenellaceae bacterium]
MEDRYKKRVITADKAVVKLMTLCSRGEKSSFDAAQLLRRWGVSQEDSDSIIERLKSEKYIDDSRYCDAYVREKSRLSNFGAQKIKQNLILKRLPVELIESSMSRYISSDSMRDKLELMLSKKRTEIERREDDTYKIKDKLIRFAISRGYDYHLICEVLES